MPAIPKKKSEKVTPPKSPARKAIYKEPSSQMCIADKAITMEIAKKLLGWQEQDKDVEEYHFTDLYGKKIVCHNNITNRPLYMSIVAILQQEHLRKRWVLNGEPLIIGRTGFILNGQHQLISLVFACQKWEQSQEDYPEWSEMPTMEKFCVFGIDEADSVVNTMDTCKPRTLSDAIYRSEFFADVKKSDRKVVARMLDYAVKMLWHRTGADRDAFAPRRTHSEALAFIGKHPRILECVKHIHTEDGTKKQIARYISLGYAAGLMYLMGSSFTGEDGIKSYRESPEESHLDWKLWELAQTFWTLLAASDRKVAAVQSLMSKMVEDGQASRPERTGVLTKAWQRYSAGKPVKVEEIQLQYETDDETGMSFLSENPQIGGIDLADVLSANVDPTVEEIEERAEEIKKENSDKKVNGGKKGKKKPSALPEIGQRVWIAEEGTDDEYWSGIVDEVYETNGEHICKVKCSNKKSFEVPAVNCLTTNPDGD